jgi:hypothetical protein
LAVTGSVTTSGSVSLAPGSSVSVINSAQNPVPVQDIREPFQARSVPGPISSGATFPAVPAGKRLVIEHFSVRVDNSATAVGPDACVLTSTDPSLAGDLFGVQPIASNAINHIFVASVQTKFYVQTGQTPQIFCDFLPGAGASGFIGAFISGYFTPLP